MSERTSLLHARGGGRELLLSVADLQEVVAFAPVTPLPGGPPGIQGVVIHQGEFLPVLAWKDLPGCAAATGESTALAVFRRRLGIPLERLVGTVDTPAGDWAPCADEDPWNAFASGMCEVEGERRPVVDLDRLLVLLHRFRTER
ncbi:chemotaxis protein CheW [Geothrix sp. 21YS21S-4]|uniref:chemotaxis protein CheW n=1 Tax=Geothrix sp. 21YS21S-4 TaxID=3068889 RepID=UPI0027BA0ED3|nr:chemotaxis protein CheW [Geothrix sp. 21YS21S-4]